MSLIKNHVSRHQYNYDADRVSEATGLECEPGSSYTVQADAESADINFIVRQYGLTGTLPQGIRVPTYEDFSESVNDYQTALNAILEAEESFMQLASPIRARFHNDPQAFLEFCSKAENLPEMRSMGLAVQPPDSPRATIDTPPATTPQGGA